MGDSWVLLDADRLAGTGIPEALREGTSLDGIASLVEAGESTARLGETRVDEGIGVTEVVSVVGVVDVAAAGTPYPVQVSAGGVADLHLNGFDAPVDVRPPTGNVVDLGSLPGLG